MRERGEDRLRICYITNYQVPIPKKRWYNGVFFLIYNFSFSFSKNWFFFFFFVFFFFFFFLFFFSFSRIPSCSSNEEKLLSDLFCSQIGVAKMIT